MRNRLILAALGILMIAAAVLVFQMSRLEPPAAQPMALVDTHDHANELLPPAPVGLTLCGGNSGELRSSPVARVRAKPVIRTGTPGASSSLEVFAPARFQATPFGDAAATAGTSPQVPTVTTAVTSGSTVQTIR